MRSVMLDTRGRLNEFHAIPPQVDRPDSSPAAPDWKPLFDAAGLDLSAFTAAAPEWAPNSFVDTRAAWEGQYRERSDVRIRVEAAGYRGRPVSFLIVGPWTRPARMVVAPNTRIQSMLRALNLTVFFGALAAAALLARRNVRTNRADRRTAVRLAYWLAVAISIAWAVKNHHTTAVNVELDQFSQNLGYGLYLGGTLCVMYLAIEPYARRLWPDGLLGWTRLFAGHIRDPRVGRDILIGCLFGVVESIIEAGRIIVLPLAGQPMPQPVLGQNLNLLHGPQYIVGMVASWTYGPLQSALFAALLFVGLRFLLRRDWPAFVVAIVVFLAIGDGSRAILGGVGLNTVFYVFLYSTILIAIVRFGLLVTTIGLIVDSALTNVPFPGHLSGWAGMPAVWTIVLVLALMAFGFYASRAGQPLFGKFEV
jgi:hypothetical protein